MDTPHGRMHSPSAGARCHDSTGGPCHPAVRDIPAVEELFCAYYTSYDEAHIRTFYEKIRHCQDIRVSLSRNNYEPEKWCIEVNHRDASKATALLRIQKMIRADRLVVFGDAENDIPMFEASDEAYATADACEALKGIATGVIGKHDEDCVAKWLAQAMHTRSRFNQRFPR